MDTYSNAPDFGQPVVKADHNECRNTEHAHLGEHYRRAFCTPVMPPASAYADSDRVRAGDPDGPF